MKIENLVGIFDDNQYGGKDKVAAKKLINKTDLEIYDMIDDKNKDRKDLMRTLLIPLSSNCSTTVSVGIFIKAGSRDETKLYGIAHFLEHMTFNGTKKRTYNNLMLEMDSIGCTYNAMTSTEFTLYYISGNPQDIELIIDIIIDLYLNPLYPESDIAKEKKVVLDELNLNKDKTYRVLSEYINQHLYKDVDESLARPIIGYKETINNITRNDILKFRDKNYNGSNCLLCISGNFIKEDAIELIEKIFNAKLKKFNIPDKYNHEYIKHDPIIKDILLVKPELKQHLNITKGVNQTIINIIFNAYDNFNYYNDVNNILCDVLSNGFSSRLFKLLRTKMNVCYTNSSFVRNYRDNGQMYISVAVNHNVVYKTIEAILDEINNIRENGITEEELNIAKKQNSTSLLFQFKEPFEYLMYYGLQLLNNQPLYSISDMLDNISNVTMNDINLVIKNVFNKNNIVVVTMGQYSEKNKCPTDSKCKINREPNKRTVSKLINNMYY